MLLLLFFSDVLFCFVLFWGGFFFLLLLLLLLRVCVCVCVCVCVFLSFGFKIATSVNTLIMFGINGYVININ